MEKTNKERMKYSSNGDGHTKMAKFYANIEDSYQ